MSVTPLVATSRLKIFYTSDLPHVQQFLCDSVFVGGSYELQRFSGGSIATSTFISQYMSLILGFFDTSTVFQSWTLENFVGGAYVQVDEGSIGLSGTNAASTPTKGAQYTWTFYDDSGKKVRFRNLGANIGAAGAFKFGYAALGTAAKALVDDLLNHTSGHLGDVVRGRSATELKRFLFFVVDYNRKSRRRLGLV